MENGEWIVGLPEEFWLMVGIWGGLGCSEGRVESGEWIVGLH